MQGDRVNQDTHQQSCDRHQDYRQVGVNPQVIEQQVHAEHAVNDQHIVGKIDDLHHAPDEGHTYGCHPVDKPQQQTVNQK